MPSTGVRVRFPPSVQLSPRIIVRALILPQTVLKTGAWRLFSFCLFQQCFNMISKRHMIKPRLVINHQRINQKTGEASLYLRIIIEREKKDFPLKMSWPADKIDYLAEVLLKRSKRDLDVDDYNLIIACEKAKYTEIQKVYRLRKEELTMEKLKKEVRIFDTRECFTSYIELERNRRYRRKEIEKKTWQNAHASKMSILEYDNVCLFKNIDEKWINGYKTFLRLKKYKPGTIWARLSALKTYLNLASRETMIYVNESVLSFKNPKPSVSTTFLDRKEIALLIELFDHDLTDVQQRVLRAFLFACFTSLRISDVFAANSKWELQDGFVEFIPFKGRKRQKSLKIPLIPIARSFIDKGVDYYFKLPNLGEYNETLKELAAKAGIAKNLTSHVARHTFGYLYMSKVENIFGLKEIMGHSKLETTERYAHLDDEYKMESTLKIQDGFGSLMRRIDY